MVSHVLSDLIRRFTVRRSPGRGFEAVLWCALLLLAAGMHFCRSRIDPLPSRDSEQYIRFAESVAAASYREVVESFPPDVLRAQPPLLLSAMVFGVRAGFPAERVGRALMLLADLLLCAALGMIARELWHDWRMTAAAMLLAAVFPICVKYPVQILRDPLYWCFVAWALCWATRAAAGKRIWSNWFLAALCTALAILTRREGLELLPVFAVWLCGFDWRRRGWQRILLVKVAVAVEVLAVLLLVLLPVERAMAERGSRWHAGQFSAIRYYGSRLW